MSADDILNELVRIRPDFRAFWDRENHFQDTDDQITECGVFSQFSHYFRDEHQKMRKEELEAIAALVGRCEGDDFLTDSAYTCFLENIAGDPPDGTLTPYLSARAQEFMIHWRPHKSEPIQSIQRNAGSRPSSGDSPATATPSAPAPRGCYEEKIVKRIG